MSASACPQPVAFREWDRVYVCVWERERDRERERKRIAEIGCLEVRGPGSVGFRGRCQRVQRPDVAVFLGALDHPLRGMTARVHTRMTPDSINGSTWKSNPG